jgi:hypothetical protein
MHVTLNEEGQVIKSQGGTKPPESGIFGARDANGVLIDEGARKQEEAFNKNKKENQTVNDADSENSNGQ